MRGDQDGPEQERLVRDRALARWLTSAQAATIPLTRRRHVIVEVGEHDGRECAAVTALDGEVLALYRVTSQPGLVRLDGMPPGTAVPPTALSRSLALRSNSAARRARSRELRVQSAAMLGRARASRAAAATVVARSRAFRGGSAARLDRQLLSVSAWARLKAQLATMPVIEQAKGILVARAGCDPDEAFHLLRRASQQANVPVRDLAARLVEQSISRARVTGPRRLPRP